MVKVKCKYCGVENHVTPSSVKDVNDYYCGSRECRSKAAFERIRLGKKARPTRETFVMLVKLAKKLAENKKSLLRIRRRKKN